MLVPRHLIVSWYFTVPGSMCKLLRSFSLNVARPTDLDMSIGLVLALARFVSAASCLLEICLAFLRHALALFSRCIGHSYTYFSCSWGTAHASS